MRHLLAVMSIAALAVPLSAHAADRVYIPLGNDNRLVVIDAEKDVPIGAIEGLAAVHGLAGTPDGKLLVAGSFLEREPGAEMPAKPAQMSAEEHAAHHGKGQDMPKMAGAISTVSIIDAAKGEVIRQVDVPGAVHHVAISADGRLAAVTQPGAGTVSVIDLTSYEVIATVPTGELPNYAVFDPQGRRLMVSNGGNGTVSVIDPANWSVQRKISVGKSPEHVVLSADGSTLYVNNVDDGSVSIIDLDQGEVVKTIPVGKVLHGIDLSDDGRRLYVAVRGENKVAAIDLVTGSEQSTQLSPGPYHLAAVRGSGKIYVSSADEPKAWVLRQDDLKVIGEIPIGGKGHQMVVSQN